MFKFSSHIKYSLSIDSIKIVRTDFIYKKFYKFIFGILNLISDLCNHEK